MRYKTLVPDNVWLFEDMLDKDSLTYLETEYVNNDFDMIHVNNKDFKPLMADTDMSYRVVTMDIYALNMQYKRFEGTDFYALHAEDSKKYGDLVYILYLTDEEDGELTLPSYDDAAAEWSNGFDEMTQQFDISFSPETISILPRRNRCIVMRTGIAHKVDACQGRRDSIAGWPWFNCK
jgi:Rps23 Pro-64 3,4-dihydroxylase Tpa1-like proline 4-hydroxylase